MEEDITTRPPRPGVDDQISTRPPRKFPWDPNRKINSLCSTCNEDFGGITAFDLHRVGKHEHVFSEEHPDGRRCLNHEEMLEKNMRLDKYGRWRAPGRSVPPWEKAAALAAGEAIDDSDDETDDSDTE